MAKPTYDELLKMLMELATVADNCIPSDNCSNRTLGEADYVIAQSWAMIDRTKTEAE